MRRVVLSMVWGRSSNLICLLQAAHSIKKRVEVRQQLAFDAEARAAGISLMPDCGQVPGLGTSLCAYAMTLLDEPRDIIMYDGGIPRHPREPWNYILTFNIEGLTNEYFGTTLFLRGGRQIEVRCFEEYELVDFAAPIGKLEAFTTAGGTSTMPWTYANKLRTLRLWLV